MSPEQRRLTAADRANLVAYLDGELDEAESQQFASYLTSSPVMRREIESLQQTWELLDHLPRPQVPADLASRTLLEVKAISDAGLPPWLRDIGALTSQIARVVVLALVAGVAFLAAHAAVRWAWPDPSARLGRDLSLAEHLDDYRAVGSFEFLELLDNLSEAELNKLGREAAR